MSEQGRKYDGGKLRYDLIPVLALEDMVKGLTFGTIKYDDNNWVKVPNGRKRYLAAALRHIQEYRKGNLWDEEQNIHHLSAAMNNLSFIVEKDLRGWKDTEEQDISTEDITSEELKNFLHGIIPSHIYAQDPQQENNLWYPPVEDGGNHWIENYAEDIPVDGNTKVQWLKPEERDKRIWIPGEDYADCLSWDREYLVAYRVVD